MPVQNEKVKIAIQGGLGSYHHQAAELLVKQLDWLHKPVEYIPNKTFADALDQINSGCNYAIVAVENSLYGSINPTYQLIEERRGLGVAAEIYIPIDHQLIVVDDTVLPGDIKQIYSQREALAQCRQMLAESGAEAVEYHDTALAVKHIIDGKMRNAAAVAPAQAIDVYGGHILQSSVQDAKANYTRFFLLADQPQTHSQPQPQKASVQIVLRRGPGALLEVLQVFANHNINLSRIESRPVPGSQWRYSFHLDFTWPNDQSAGQNALKQVAKIAKEYRLLGVYTSIK